MILPDYINIEPESPYIQASTDMFRYIDLTNVRHCLEIGSGSGKHCKFISDNCPMIESVLGVDIQSHMVEYAKNHYPGEKINYLDGDFLNIDFPPDHYDLIFSNYCFLYFKNKETLLKKIYNSLKRGGCFLFTDLTVHSKNPIADEYGERICAIDYTELLFRLKFTNVLFIKEENIIVNTEYQNSYCSTFKCSK